MRSGQKWKLWLFYALIAVALALLALAFWTSHAPFLRAACAIGLTVAGGGALVWLCASVRCAVCETKVVWFVVQHAPAGEWLNKLETLDACPSCGDPG